MRATPLIPFRSRTSSSQLFRVPQDYDGRMAAASRREYIWLAVVAATLITALLVVRTHAQPIKDFIEQNSFGVRSSTSS